MGHFFVLPLLAQIFPTVYDGAKSQNIFDNTSFSGGIFLWRNFCLVFFRGFVPEALNGGSTRQKEVRGTGHSAQWRAAPQFNCVWSSCIAVGVSWVCYFHFAIFSFLPFFVVDLLSSNGSVVVSVHSEMDVQW